MLKKFLCVSACLAALTAPAFADEGSWYLRGDAGLGISSYAIWDGELAFAAGAGVGYQYNSMFRTDITFDAAFDYEANFFGFSTSLDAYDVMLNGYFDFPMGSRLTPYIGAGVGYGWAEASAAGVSVDDDGVAVGGMAGVAFDVNSTMALDVGYKYRVIFIDGDEVDDHLIRAGIRFSLN